MAYGAYARTLGGYMAQKLGHLSHGSIRYRLPTEIKGMEAVAKPNTAGHSVAICWFRNDLRYHDNEILYKANQNADIIVPVYCFDPRHFDGTYKFGLPKTGYHRAKFLRESIIDLRKTLQDKGSNLVVRLGKPEEVIPEIIKSLSASLSAFQQFIVYQEEVTKEEKDVEKNIKQQCPTNCQIHSFWGSGLYHKNDLPFTVNKIPDTYTNFRKAVESQSHIRPPFSMPDELKPLPEGLPSGDIPTLAELSVQEKSNDKRTAFPFEGGETSGLARVRQYFWDTDNIAQYKETRNGLLGEEYSTKFSPWLSLGCISPRFIYAEVKKYEKERVANQSTYWVIFEMIWRDYFRYVCMKFGDRVFYLSGIMGKNIEWKRDDKLFEMWKDGRTGVPFVDANMREMKETGWMSNRGRQNVASFLIKDLGLDWRYGAEWFESQLLDHDVCSNYGNWNYAAGIGNDPRTDRKFNMIKQGLDYDAQGDFIRTWIPELMKIKTGKIHTPWKLSATELLAAEVSLGETYPHPIVIAPEWARHDHKAGNKNFNKGQGGWQQPTKKSRGIDFYFKGDKK
ncbi:unnamed protein product, partial [Meganyctiphanes norvegica]